MKIALVICGAIAGISSLLVGLSFSERELARWPRLGWLTEHRVLFALIGAAFMIIGTFIGIIDEQAPNATVEIASGPRATLAVKATASAVEREISSNLESNREEAVRLFQAGDELMKRQEFVAAAAAYRRSAARAPTKAALVNLAICLRFVADLPGALTASKSALALPYLTAEAESLHSHAMLQLGATFSSLGRRDEAAVNLEGALSYFKRRRDRLGIAATEYQRGVFAWRGGDLSSAESLFQSALRRFALAKSSAGQATVLNALGVVALDTGQTEVGIQHLSQAAALFRSAPDHNSEAAVLMNIGTAHQERCELDAAFAAFSESAAAAAALNNTQVVASALTNQANVLLERGKTVEARAKAGAALELCRNVTAPDIEGWARIYIAAAAVDEQRLSDATAELNKAEALFANINALGMFSVTLLKARSLISAKDYDAARVVLSTAAEQAEVFPSWKASVLLAKADLDEATGNDHGASQALEQARQILADLKSMNCDSKRITRRLETRPASVRGGA